MKFRSMFKVRQPGNGDKVQKSFEESSEEDDMKEIKSIPSKDNSQNSGPKTSIK